MIGQTISHYKIIEKLGEGGMGVVYKAEDTKLKRTVALKFLPSHLTRKDEDKARFLQEAQAAAALNHPNVCTIHEIHDEGANPFIVMEYVEGKTLREIINTPLSPPSRGDLGGCPSLPLKNVIGHAIQIAEALKAAHSKGIVHRDIKSENIMVTETGQVKVMDFGLAKLRGSVKLKSSSTVGTVAYMSPEHIQGKEVDARTDIFSFGVVLYDMLTGTLPFKGEYDSAMMYAIVNEEPEPIQKHRSDLSSELLHVLSRALEKNPEERYQSINEMLIDLKRLKRDTDKVSRKAFEETPVPTTQKPKKRKGPTLSGKPLWIGLGATVIAVAVLLVILFGRRERTLLSGPVKENSIAVMYFENLTGEENLDYMQRGIVELLTTNLSRYPGLDVVSSQRLFDILKSLGKEDETAITKSTATQVASHAGVKNMLMGNYLKAGDLIRVNTQICDVETGRNIGSESVDGSGEEALFHMVDALTEKVAHLMDISDGDAMIQPFKITDVTTPNLQAYKQYLLGMEQYYRFDHDSAAVHFQKAVELDTTFATAYAYLAFMQGVFQVLNPLNNLYEIRQVIDQAKRYSAQATEKERLVIHAIYAVIYRDYDTFIDAMQKYVALYPDDKEGLYYLGAGANHFCGDSKTGITYLEKCLELDPTYENAYVNLAYTYSDIGEHQAAISTIKKYIALLPDVFNTYDSAFDMYIHAGMYEEAYNSIKTALSVNPNWDWFYDRIGLYHLIKGEGDNAREQYRYLIGLDPDWEPWCYRQIGHAYVYEGRYREAAEAFQQAIEECRERDWKYSMMARHFDLARTRIAVGDFQKAYRVLEQAVEASKTYYIHSFNPASLYADYLKGRGLIREKRFEEAQVVAEKIQTRIQKESFDAYYLNFYHLLMAEWYCSQGNGREALSHFNEVHSGVTYRYPVAWYIRSAILTLNGEYDRAVQICSNLYDRVTYRFSGTGGDYYDFFYERSRIPYFLGKLHKLKGDRTQAVAYYEKAVDGWKDADEELPELVDARARLERLKNAK